MANRVFFLHFADGEVFSLSPSPTEGEEMVAARLREYRDRFFRHREVVRVEEMVYTDTGDGPRLLLRERQDLLHLEVSRGTDDGPDNP